MITRTAPTWRSGYVLQLIQRNVINMYVRNAQIWAGSHWQFFRGFLHTANANSGQFPLLGHRHFIHYPFEFIIKAYDSTSQQRHTPGMATKRLAQVAFEYKIFR